MKSKNRDTSEWSHMIADRCCSVYVRHRDRSTVGSAAACQSPFSHRRAALAQASCELPISQCANCAIADCMGGVHLACATLISPDFPSRARQGRSWHMCCSTVDEHRVRTYASKGKRTRSVVSGAQDPLSSPDKRNATYNTALFPAPLDVAKVAELCTQRKRADKGCDGKCELGEAR